MAARPVKDESHHRHGGQQHANGTHDRPLYKWAWVPLAEPLAARHITAHERFRPLAVASVVLELARGLPPATLTAISELEIATVSVDGGRLKLEWGTLNSRSGDEVEDVLWWEEGRLLGFAGIYTFGSSTVEVAGMVHPHFRRRGIGTHLLDASMGVCRKRGQHKILLVAPRTSPGAGVLADARGGLLHHSEHALDLHGGAVEGPADPTLTLRPASGDDSAEVAQILAEAFGDPLRPLNLDAPDRPVLVAERDGAVIATLRLNRTANVWGIYGFAVVPQHRGKGVGRDILRRVCLQASEAGVDHLHLEVEVNNDRAIGLYTSLGFALTTTEDYFEIPL
jgi:ribosomal protein S18 acetylase RimI-like enzyme